MNSIKNLPSLLTLCLLLAIAPSKYAVAQNPTQQPLVQQGNLEWLGAFKFPSGKFGSNDLDRFGYGGTALGYFKDSQGRETLFAQGHDWRQGNVAQVRIPTLSTTRNADNLPRASILQNFQAITEGKLGGTNGDKTGSTFVYNNSLYYGSYSYYDGDVSQSTTIGRSGLDLSVSGDFLGLYSPSGTNPGRLGRYMNTIPTEWRSLFGAPAMNGAGSLAIISRTNSGPGISVFDPADVGTKNPVPFKEVLAYPLEHPISFNGETGSCGGQSNVWNCSSNIVGSAFPSGTRSVLFFGRHGTGPNCYKDDGPASCRGTGGYNAPPYRFQVWAYDANDLLAVKNGQKAAYAVSPYGIWTLDFSYTGTGETNIIGGTYDMATGRIFLTEADGEDPIVHVLKINAGTPNGGGGSNSAPNAPRNLRSVP